jgi:hypothetical protein
LLTVSNASANTLNVFTQTCKNFADLAKRGYYNGTVFHRVIAVRTRRARTASADFDAAGPCRIS